MPPAPYVPSLLRATQLPRSPSGNQAPHCPPWHDCPTPAKQPSPNHHMQSVIPDWKHEIISKCCITCRNSLLQLLCLILRRSKAALTYTKSCWFWCNCFAMDEYRICPILIIKPHKWQGDYFQTLIQHVAKWLSYFSWLWPSAINYKLLDPNVNHRKKGTVQPQRKKSVFYKAPKELETQFGCLQILAGIKKKTNLCKQESSASWGSPDF